MTTTTIKWTWDELDAVGALGECRLECEGLGLEASDGWLVRVWKADDPQPVRWSTPTAGDEGLILAKARAEAIAGALLVEVQELRALISTAMRPGIEAPPPLSLSWARDLLRRCAVAENCIREEFAPEEGRQPVDTGAWPADECQRWLEGWAIGNLSARRAALGLKSAAEKALAALASANETAQRRGRWRAAWAEWATRYVPRPRLASNVGDIDAAHRERLDALMAERAAAVMLPKPADDWDPRTDGTALDWLNSEAPWPRTVTKRTARRLHLNAWRRGVRWAVEHPEDAADYGPETVPLSRDSAEAAYADARELACRHGCGVAEEALDAIADLNKLHDWTRPTEVVDAVKCALYQLARVTAERDDALASRGPLVTDACEVCGKPGHRCTLQIKGGSR